MVSDEGGCSYSVDKENWAASLQTALREWVGEWIYGVDIKDTQDITIQAIDKFRIMFSKKYELYSLEDGKRVLYKVVVLNGIAASTPESIFIKVNDNNFADNLNHPVRLVKCKTPDDTDLPVEERIKLLQQQEEQRLRSIETGLGDVIDDGTGLAATTAAGRITPFGGVSEHAIGAVVEGLKEERRRNVNSRIPRLLKIIIGGKSRLVKCAMPFMALVLAGSLASPARAMDRTRLECLSFTIWVAHLSYDEKADPVADMIKMCELKEEDYAEVSEFYETVSTKDPWIFKQSYGEEAFEVFKRVSADAVKYTQKIEAEMIRENPIK